MDGGLTIYGNTHTHTVLLITILVLRQTSFFCLDDFNRLLSSVFNVVAGRITPGSSARLVPEAPPLLLKTSIIPFKFQFFTVVA